MCSLIHKFGRRGGEASEKDYESFIEEVKAALPQNFSPKGDFYVFVDECHRTQSGRLHKAMDIILPNAVFVGFTGTPLMKKDKLTSLEIFGPYIHRYKFDEAVRDKVVLDLRYEAREVEQDVVSQEKIDAWFESKTNGLNDVAKARLKKRWGNLQKVFSSKARLGVIASDIIFDMETKPRLRKRGVTDIFIACHDNLKGLGDAINAVFPRTKQQSSALRFAQKWPKASLPKANRKVSFIK
jgi:type I restriction enzyme R subunit